MLNKFIQCVISITLSVALVGCATTGTTVGVGTVTSTKKIKDEHFTPHHSTYVGAETGAASGAVIGGLYGTLAGTGAAATLAIFGSTTTPLMLGIIVTTAGIGAISGGISGGIIGGGVGYIADVSEKSGLYEYKVKQDNEKNILTIVQHSSFIPENSRVEILQNDNAKFIKAVN